jgi:hypothetical protein
MGQQVETVQQDEWVRSEASLGHARFIAQGTDANEALAREAEAAGVNVAYVLYDEGSHVCFNIPIARAGAEPALLESDRLGSRGIAQTRIGFRGNPDTVTRSARARGTPEQRASYDWWIANGLAPVGSPETVRKKLEEHQRRIGYDVFCANHRFGTLPPESVLKSLKLFGEEVIPAFA